jgi:MFS family permease
MVASRIGAAVPHMVYAGSLPFLVQEWQLSGVQAGTVQGIFNLCYAVSLLLCSLAADRVGPARIFSVANWSSTAIFLACARRKDPCG